MNKSSKIALVHDYFIQMGGAERVAEEFHKMFPKASMFSMVDTRGLYPPELRESSVKTSWMQHMPGIKTNFRHYFALYPLAIESFDFSPFDLILSSSSGYAKGVRKRKDAIHVCYCHTPTRWIWRYEDYAAREGFGGATRKLLPLVISGLRHWDLRASRQPDYYIVNSNVVAKRVEEIYKRRAIVIPPPIDVKRFATEGRDDDYYLILSRLVSYKRVDLAIEACRKLNRRLIVIGDGPDRKRLSELAGENTEFLGRQSDRAVARYAGSCRALIFPGEEDFGMTPLEINAAGRPVIAFRGGGATETVVEGKTGVFFDSQTVGSLSEAIEDFENRSWNRPEIREHAELFDQRVFARRIQEFLRQVAPASCVNEITKPVVYPAFGLEKRTV